MTLNEHAAMTLAGLILVAVVESHTDRALARFEERLVDLGINRERARAEAVFRRAEFLATAIDAWRNGAAAESAGGATVH